MSYLVRQLGCYLRFWGHDFRVKCQPGRIFLRCVECGKESRGWRAIREKEIVMAVKKEARKDALEKALVRVRQLIHLSFARIFW